MGEEAKKKKEKEEKAKKKKEEEEKAKTEEKAGKKIEKMKLGDLKDGEFFTKCIADADWRTKNWDEEVTVAERLKTGCCPKGYVYGSHRVAYHGGVFSRGGVICGFTKDLK